MDDARVTLSGAIAVLRALARREECFPRNARGIVDPRLFGLGIATGRLSLLDDRAASFVQTRIDFLQFILALNLNAEMIQARVFTPSRNGEVNARIIEHPFGIVRLQHRGLHSKERGIEPDSSVEVIDTDVNMHAFHGRTPL